jgi:hypothetical protein
MVNMLIFLKDQDGGWHAPLRGLGSLSFTSTSTTSTREKKGQPLTTAMMQTSISGLGKADEETFLAWKQAAESGRPAPLRIAFYWPDLGTKMIEGNYHIRMPNRRWKKIEIESAGEVVSSWEPLRKP